MTIEELIRESDRKKTLKLKAKINVSDESYAQICEVIGLSKDHKPNGRKLPRYLASMPIEHLGDLACIMYLGRDRIIISIDDMTIYEEFLNYRQFLCNEQSGELDINLRAFKRVYDKLYEYLEEGLWLIGRADLLEK